MKKHKVLSTKKLDALQIRHAEEVGIEIIEQAFIDIRPVWNKETYNRIVSFAEAGKTGIILTSAHAAEILNRYMLAEDTCYVVDWKIFCLLGKTKNTVLKSVFLGGNIAGEAKNAAGLAQEILSSNITELIFFCSNQRREELPDILQKAGMQVHEVIVYETIETPVVTTENFDGILFFSPSAVKSFFSVNSLKQQVACFAIGPTTAKAIKQYCDNRIIVSEHPDQQTMMAAVYFYLNNKNLYG